MYFCLHQTLPSFYTPKSRDQKKKRKGKKSRLPRFHLLLGQFFCSACLASPSRLSSQVCNSQRIEVISQRVEEIDCLANLRIPWNPLFSLYRCICAPVMNHMQPFLCYCPRCPSLCKSTIPLLMFLKSKTKFTSVYLFSFSSGRVLLWVSDSAFNG